MRLKDVHIINTVSFMDRILSVVKPFIQSNLMNIVSGLWLRIDILISRVFKHSIFRIRRQSVKLTRTPGERINYARRPIVRIQNNRSLPACDNLFFARVPISSAVVSILLC